MRSLAFLLLLITFASTVSAEPLNCAERKTLTFGMIPFTSANITSMWMQKINREVKKKSCLNLDFSSANNFEKYIDKATQHEFDVMVTPPHIASYLIASFGFKPVATLVWDSSYLYFTPVPSSIESLEQFEGGTVALPDPWAEVSILVRAELSPQSGAIQYQYHQNFNQVMQALLDKRVDVGVLLSPFYQAYQTRIKGKIRLLRTMPFPSHGMLIAQPDSHDSDIIELFDLFSSFEKGTGLFWKSFQAVSKQQVIELHDKQKGSVAALQLLIEGADQLKVKSLR